MKRDPVRTQVRQGMISLGIKSPDKVIVDHYTESLKNGSLIAVYKYGGRQFWPTSDNPEFQECRKGALGYLYFHMGKIEVLDFDAAFIIVNSWVGY